jgi:16S rRNA (adenine1518-N6/adenine1519-N6)-dimethyltransferase
MNWSSGVKKFLEKMKKKNDKEKSSSLHKKFLGQHFLRNPVVSERMIERVDIGASDTVVEIGCGDGALTERILALTICQKLLCFEIDPYWIGVTKALLPDPRLQIKHRDALDVSWGDFISENNPVVMLANLPYQITFPFFFMLQRNKKLFREGVVMIQEETAQNLVATSGRAYRHVGLFLRCHFEYELLDKVDPKDFEPSPKVFSRTIYFKTKHQELGVADSEKFWDFIRVCFRYPRQTLVNNLRKANLLRESIDEETKEQFFSKRARQLDLQDFVKFYEQLNKNI